MIRLLLLADTHLGFDLPARPRVEKRRRGPDFFANTRLALEPAIRGEVDLVVHGGDLLYRSNVPAGLVGLALEPLLEVADAGVPVVLVPGNHERSVLPYPLFAAHEMLHVLDHPQTVELIVNGTKVALGGFPCVRDGIRDVFAGRLRATNVLGVDADLRLLCIHQTVEGARVKGYTFLNGADVIPGSAVPDGLAAVLSGHIHRAQVLDRDLGGRALAAPVYYPGSVERTSLAERDEAKGFMILEFEADARRGGRLVKNTFHELPARPLFAVAIDASGLGAATLSETIQRELEALPGDAVVQLRVGGELVPEAAEMIRAARLRAMHPPTMTVDLRYRRAGG